MLKKWTGYSKKLRFAFIKTAFAVIFAAWLFLPQYTPFEAGGDNFFTVYLNGINVGTVADTDRVDTLLRQARREIAGDSGELVFIDTDLTVEGKSVLWGSIEPEEKVEESMKAVMLASRRETLLHSYTVKIDEFTVNLESSSDVLALLQASLDKYDDSGNYTVNLTVDGDRELNVLTTRVRDREEERREEEEKKKMATAAGEAAYFVEAFAGYEPQTVRTFDDYDYGLKELKYGDTVEVVEAYLLPEDLTDRETAIEEVTKDQEKNQIYQIQSGDTLGGIAYSNDLTIEELVAMNPDIENENSVIREGQEIIVTVPEPELSVERTELEYYEESYDAEVQYVDNDSWYTNEEVVRQEPSAGFHKVAVEVYYRDNTEVGRTVVKEEVVMEAVPKIVERGTKIPPTYIKPIYGGRISSGFGGRKAPTRGASTYHKGIDWATPIGTQVMASCAGTVTRAGWGSGYGYLVCIRHPDGRETRYGHLSKILVKAGQTVKQGQKIALSGNTGRSTGPHVHFEMLINGSAVNPLKYLN